MQWLRLRFHEHPDGILGSAGEGVKDWTNSSMVSQYTTVSFRPSLEGGRPRTIDSFNGTACKIHFRLTDGKALSVVRENKQVTICFWTVARHPGGSLLNR